MYGWKSVSSDFLSAECPNLAHWIINVNHLKKALIDYGINIELRLLDEAERTFPGEEAEIVDESQGLVRQIYFQQHGVPLTYGRTLVPERTYRAFHAQFKALGTRAIGEALLHDKKNVVRGPLEFGFVDSPSDLFQFAVQGVKNPPARLWGRRSEFLIENKYPLLVVEIFFPSLPVFL